MISIRSLVTLLTALCGSTLYSNEQDGRAVEMTISFNSGQENAWVQKYNTDTSSESDKYFTCEACIDWLPSGDHRGPSQGGCLRFDLTSFVESKGIWAQHAGGMIRLPEAIPADTSFTLSFHAKHLSGYENLFVHRKWGGNLKPTVVKLSPDWQHYEMNLIFSSETTDISFALVEKLRPHFQLSGPGAFLLDEIRISYRTPKTTTTNH